MLQKAIIPHEKALAFITAGKARFTVVGLENRFSFYVMQPKFDGKPAENMLFVKVMDSKRSNDMTYIGLLKRKDGVWTYEFRYPNTILAAMKENPNFAPTLTENSLEVKAFNYVVVKLQQGRLDARTELWHEGKCACCGRPLTVPEAIQRGWGEVCLRKLKAKELLLTETKEEFLAR